EAFNLDKEVWGEDAVVFEYLDVLCWTKGMRFSMIEIKAFVFILLTNFAFKPTDDHIIKANVVLTRPYIKGKFSQGSRLPLIIEKHGMRI
ncbi:hypothetical protein MPER_15885, partial [Moniliophthora perniciosa FA553]